MGYNSTTFSQARNSKARNACNSVKKPNKKAASATKKGIVFSGDINDLKERFPGITLLHTTSVGLSGIEFPDSNSYELLEHSSTNSGKLTRVRFRVLDGYYQDGILIKPGIHEFAV